MLVPRKKLLWSVVTPGNINDEGYSDVRFIAKRDSRAHAPKIEPKPISTFPQNETLAVACWLLEENRCSPNLGFTFEVAVLPVLLSTSPPHTIVRGGRRHTCR